MRVLHHLHVVSLCIVALAARPSTGFLVPSTGSNINKHIIHTSPSTSTTTTSTRRIPTTLKNSVGHDYERDRSRSSSDASMNVNVDVDAVNGLLSQRLQARKTGDFDKADRIRDQLNREHQVTVFDKDKIWAVESNSGRYGDNRGGRRDTRSGVGGGGGGRFGGRGRVGGRGAGRDRSQGRGESMRDFRSDFGPNGHDYHFCPDAGPNASQMSEPDIHKLVADRLMAKMNRDFDAADKVQLMLAQKGVYINDRAKEWRADGVQFIDPSEGRQSRDTAFTGTRAGRSGAARMGVPSVNRDRNRPFVLSRHSLPLPEDDRDSTTTSTALQLQIEQWIAERDTHKWAQHYEEADRIRDALLAEFDVVLDDRIREWSIGGSFGRDNDTKRAHTEAVNARDYVQSTASLELPEGVTLEQIQAKIDARTIAKRTKQYEASDAMRDQLLQDHGIVLNDKIKMWSIGGDFGMDDPVNARAQANRQPFVRRGGGLLSDDDLKIIEGLLAQRVEAKRLRHFEESDEIRTHLYETYAINVDDKTREWRVLSDDYVQIVGDSTEGQQQQQQHQLTVDEVKHVTMRIDKRTLFKREKMYQAADEIRDELYDNYSVLLNDKKKEWKVDATSSFGGRQRQGQDPINDAAPEERLRRGPVWRKQVNSKDGDDDDYNDYGDNELNSNVSTDSTSAVMADDAVSEEESVPFQSSQPSAPPAPSTTSSRDELTALTVPLLKEKLREVGKPVSGKKAELVDRLLLL